MFQLQQWSRLPTREPPSLAISKRVALRLLTQLIRRYFLPACTPHELCSSPLSLSDHATVHVPAYLLSQVATDAELYQVIDIELAEIVQASDTR